MAARHLSLALVLACAPVMAQEASRPEAALEAVAYKALEAQEKPPLLEEAAADWRRLRETPSARAAFARPPLAEKAALVEQLLTSILTAERYAALRDDESFRALCGESGARWSADFEWAPGKRGAFTRGTALVGLAELRDIAVEHERRRAERESRWRPPQGDAESVPASAAEAAMEEGRRRYEALLQTDPQAAAALLSSLYDFAGNQRRRDDLRGDGAKQRAVNRVAQIEQQLRRRPARSPAAAEPRPESPSASAPALRDGSALRAAFCEAFGRLDLPAGLGAAARACSFAQGELRLVLDKARATAALLELLAGESSDEARRRRFEGLARELTAVASAAVRDLPQLERLQRDADRVIEGPPGAERTLATLERERVLLASATIREAVAADLLGQVGEAVSRVGGADELLARLSLAPESLSEDEWSQVGALFERAGAQELQAQLRAALAESAAARAAVSALYDSRPALARYRAAHAGLAAGRLSAIADGRLSDPERRFSAGELGLHALPSFIEVTPGVVDGARGVWAHRHERRVFTALDGSFELTLALGRHGEVTGRALRRPQSRFIELSDGQGRPQGAEFELGGVLGAARPRDAAREAAVELAAALRRPELGGRNAPAPDPEALASFLERSLAEAQGPPPASPSLSVSPEGELELQLWYEDGTLRVHRARFEEASDFLARPRGRALVARVPYVVRPGEEPSRPSSKKAVEYLADGSVVYWRESRGTSAAGVFTDGRVNVAVRLHRAVRGAAFGDWVEEEAEGEPRERVVEALPDTSLWRHFKTELYSSLTEGDTSRVGRGPVTVGNAVHAAESLLSGLGWAGDKFYHGVVGIGQTDVAYLTGSPLGQLEAQATMARLRGLTPEQAQSLVRGLPAEQVGILDSRIYEDRQRDMRAAGETMTRLGAAQYQRQAFAPPTDAERARALLERFGAGTYGARAVEEAGRRGGAARYALYAGGAAMQFGEETARSLPQLLALNALGRLAALRVTGGTTLARAAGTGAQVAQVVTGRLMQVTGAFGTVDAVAGVADGARHGEWDKAMLNAGQAVSGVVDFIASGRELARSGERARALEARQRALAVFAGEAARTRARAASAPDGPSASRAGAREGASPRRAVEYLFGDRAGRVRFARGLAEYLNQFNPLRRAGRRDNLDFQGRAMRRYLQDPDAVAGALDSGLFARQSYSDCAVRAMYNHPMLRPVQDAMPYERFLQLAESVAGTRLRDEGTTASERVAVLEALGYSLTEQGPPANEAALIARLRADGAVLGGFTWREPMAPRGYHAVVVAGAIRGTDGSWRYLVADSHFGRYQEYSYSQLTDLGLQTRAVGEGTPDGRPLAAPVRARAIEAALTAHPSPPPAPGGGAPAEGAPRWPWRRAPSPLREVPRDAPADGSHLVPPGQDRGNRSFTRPMAAATDVVRARTSARLAENRPFTEGDIRDLLNVAGDARRAVALAARNEDADADPPHAFGARIPESPAEIELYNQMARSHITGLDGPNTEDFALLNGPGRMSRHNQYYAPLDAILRAQSRGEGGGLFADLGPITVGGQTYPASHLMRYNVQVDGVNYPTIKVIHPDFEHMAGMRRAAREILARAVSDPAISEAAFVDRLADAYRLLCHATPWVRGSPAAIESTFDGLLRAKFGRTLGPKRSEPFWGVMLWDRAKPYTGRDFLANYTPAER